MGASDLQAAGYRTASTIKDFEYVQYCGGKGGGGLAKFLNTQRAIVKIKNNPFTVRNELLLLLNEIFEVNADGGDAGGGDRYAGARQPLYWAAVADPAAITNAQVIARNDRTDSELPYYVTLDHDDLPQPDQAGWAGFTYVVIVWELVGAVSYSAGVLNDDGQQTAEVVVIDYQQDVKI